MILKELHLISFGKFENEKFKLEEGLNILYGENESGKTTIHNFIDGMFYGFLKPYARQKNYLAEYRKYRPWDKEQYSGILKLINNGNVYRIERDFAKSEVRVYDDLTGDDITKHIDTGEKLKIHLPGIYFFDFNNMVYKNTISIKQLGNKIDLNLSKEVKDRLANISTSLDDDISVKNAISDLEKQLGDIGTERAYTRPYGRSIMELNKLENQIKHALEKQEEYNKYINESLLLREKIEEEEEKLSKLKLKLQKINVLEKEKTYEEGLHIKQELEKIDVEIEKLKGYSNVSFDDYILALKLENNREHLYNEIQELRQKLNDLEERLKNIKIGTEEEIANGIKAQELYKDIGTYDEMEDEKNALVLNSRRNKLEILNSRLKTIVEKEKKSKIIMIILIIFTIAALGLGFINKLLTMFVIPLGATAFYIQSSRKKLNQEIEDLKQEIKDIEGEENNNNKRIIYIENYQKDVLLKYNCSSKLELKRLHDDIYLNHMNQIQIANKIDELNRDKEQIISTLELKENMIKKITNKINAIVLKNKFEALEEFKDGLEKKRRYDAIIKDKKNNIQVLEKILGNISLEELKIELTNYDDEYFKDVIDVDKSNIVKEIKKKEEMLSTIKDSSTRFEVKIDNLNKEVKQLVILEEEIKSLEDRIERFDNRIKSIKMAKNTIENISKNIHSQFAPVINKEVSKIIKVITGGKYKSVKVNDDLNIAVENPITKEIIDIDSLSGGTIDQLYFALRFSVISSIKGKGLPLILDDCFIQYDDERLNNILGFLGQISDEKQILLFTCQRREKEILDKLGLKYNLIKLA